MVLRYAQVVPASHFTLRSRRPLLGGYFPALEVESQQHWQERRQEGGLAIEATSGTGFVISTMFFQ